MDTPRVIRDKTVRIADVQVCVCADGKDEGHVGVNVGENGVEREMVISTTITAIQAIRLHAALSDVIEWTGA